MNLLFVAIGGAFGPTILLVALFVFLRAGNLSLRPGKTSLRQFMRDFFFVSRALFKIGIADFSKVGLNVIAFVDAGSLLNLHVRNDFASPNTASLYIVAAAGGTFSQFIPNSPDGIEDVRLLPKPRWKKGSPLPNPRLPS